MGPVEEAGPEDARREVALACRVLARAGLAEDVLGHVSVRTGPGHFLVRCRGPQERGLIYTTQDDIHLAGRTPPGYTKPIELSIHVAVLRSRPEVNAVVHVHPPAVVTADLAGLSLRPVVGAYNIAATRMAADGIPVYPRSVLIRRADQAAQMLTAMGDAPVCVLRGHGIVTTGSTVAEAVVRALNMESLARVILGAAQAGRVPEPIPDEDMSELPDLGAALNTESVWRYHVERVSSAEN